MEEAAQNVANEVEQPQQGEQPNYTLCWVEQNERHKYEEFKKKVAEVEKEKEQEKSDELLNSRKGLKVR